MFENEAIEYYCRLMREKKENKGDWTYSPVMKPILKKMEDLLNEMFKKGTTIEQQPKTEMIDYAIKTKRKIDEYCGSPRNILEIGGRFGDLCSLYDVKNYYYVELPEMLPFAYWYLKNKGKKAIFLASWELPKLKAKIDLFINTRSFHHMTKKNLDYYFKEIDRLKPTYLFLRNRNHKIDKTDVIMDKYPIPEGYKLIKAENDIKVYKYAKNR